MLHTPSVSVATAGNSRSLSSASGRQLARYQLSAAVSAPGRERSAIARSVSPSPRIHSRKSSQSSRISSCSAVPSYWNSSGYQLRSRCSIVGRRSPFGWPTESTAKRPTRSLANAASAHPTAAPQSCATTCARSTSSVSSTASMSVTLRRTP